VPGFLDDHAILLEAVDHLYETTFDHRWYRRLWRSRRDSHRALLGRERGGVLHDRR